MPYVILCAPPGMSLESYNLEETIVAGVLTKPIYPSQLFDMLVLLWQKGGRPAAGIVTGRDLTTMSNDSASVAVSAVLSYPGIHVLLAEDQPISQQLMKIIFSKAQCDVELAVNGLEAARKAQEGCFDIIFMDCQMPEMDGFEATRAIRDHEAGTNRRVPIVALTADAMQGDKERCLKAGMDDYINKPVKPAQVYEMIQKYALTPVASPTKSAHAG